MRNTVFQDRPSLVQLLLESPKQQQDVRVDMCDVHVVVVIVVDVCVLLLLLLLCLWWLFVVVVMVSAVMVLCVFCG